MTHNWSKPTTTSLKTDFPTEIRNMGLSLAKQDLSGDSNIPTDAIQYNSSSKRWQKYNGSSWATLNIHDVIPDKTGTETVSGAWTFSNVITLPITSYLPSSADSHFTGLTSDGSDNRGVFITPGGAGGWNRGGQIASFGNEHATYPGQSIMFSGAGSLAAGSSVIATKTGVFVNSYEETRSTLYNSGLYLHNTSHGTYPGEAHLQSAETGKVVISTPLSAQQINFEQGGTLAWRILSGQLYYNTTASLIAATTSDGSDSKAVSLAGGGAASTSRGGFLSVHGNEHATRAGRIDITGGLGSGNADVTIDATDGAVRLRYGATDKISITSNIFFNTNVRPIISDFVFAPNTADGFDSATMLFSAGGVNAGADRSENRGSFLYLRGADAVSKGFELVASLNGSGTVQANGTGTLGLFSDSLVDIDGSVVSITVASSLQISGITLGAAGTCINKLPITINGTDYALMICAA